MSTPVKIFIADDDRWLLESMSDWLSSEGFAVSTAPSLEKAKTELSRLEPDLFLCDVRFEDGDGLKFLRQVRRSHPDLPVIMMSGYAGPDAARESLANGAFELLSKPIIDQELRTTIDRALNQKNIEKENARLKEELDRRFGMESIVSHDLRMLKIFEMIDQVADTKATILITGENGTGKSMIARAIHKKSARRKKPFVEVACGALPDTLLESELFGHVAGAFTGAIGNKTGKFLQADQGTLFLDEIGTASTALQIKLLRALQEFEFEPLGGTDTISVDTRAILATNENLEKAVNEGRFRQDLFYRIQVIHIELPSLRERLDDIPILANHFLRKVCAEYNRKISGFSNNAMNALLSHSWPGNIRELENAIQRSVLLAKSDAIEVDALPSSITKRSSLSDSQSLSSSHSPATGHQSDNVVFQTPATIIPLSEALEGPERQIILSALKANSWNRNLTADLLGINRTTLYKKMKKLGIEEPTPQ
ncbi:MAG: sigma-54 dependent transcriptional regulator [Pirellula sp.]|jgi:DNA-binding NtrC family response regulator|nr:sigma-54 dependent transcriptional regulator [Pirellula sp.]